MSAMGLEVLEEVEPLAVHEVNAYDLDQRVAYATERELIRREAHRRADASEHAAAPNAWLPVEMSLVSSTPLAPCVGWRSDEAPLFYKGMLNVIFGDSEGGKTWLGVFVAAQLLARGKRVVIMDYEDGAVGMKVRLMKLGVAESVINDPALFVYINPQGCLDDQAFEGLREVFASAEMVMIDAFSEAAATEGVDDYRAIDVAGWYTRVPRRIAGLGPAVVLIDHVNKSADNKSQQTGSQHKKSGVDGVSVKVTAVTAFAEGHGGSSMVHVGKDRHSGVKVNSLRGTESEPMRFAVFACDSVGNWSLDIPAEVLATEELEFAREYQLEAAVGAAFSAGHTTKNAVRQYVRDVACLKAGSPRIDAAFDKFHAAA